MITFYSHMKTSWYTFIYNFGWSNCVEWLDGNVSRISLTIPIIGYLILFNDSIVRNITFFELTSGHSELFISGGTRLKLVYMGMVILGVSNILFRWKRPYVLRFARDKNSYVDFALKNFTAIDFIELHEVIRSSGQGAYTRHGDYYDSEWNAFLNRSLGVDSARRGEDRDPETAHWAEAKSQYEGLLRSILIETFFRECTRTRRGWLVLCLMLASFGYLLLAIPSTELFIRVVMVICIPLIGLPA